MNNQFDATNYPEGEPSRLNAGYRWAWTRSDITSVYSTDLYTLNYDLLSVATGTVRRFVAGKVDGAHVIELTKTETDIDAGEYRWQAIIVRDSDSAEVLVDEGTVEVVERLGETSSHAYKVLMAIRATIEGIATREQQSYSIAGRTLSRYTPEDLMKLEKEYSRRWKMEKDKIDKLNGKKVNNTVKIKMSA